MTWFDTHAPLLWREPIETKRRQEFQEMFTLVQQTSGSGALAWRAAIEALLLSPRFLYVVPTGELKEENLLKLNGHAIATRLAYLLLGHGPGPWLIEHAVQGSFDTEEGIREVAKSMLDGPYSQRSQRELFLTFLGIGDNASFGSAPRDLVASMRKETAEVIDEALRSHNGSLDALFLSDHTYVDEALAAYYGATWKPDRVEKGLMRVAQADIARHGVLTHASFLSEHAHTEHIVYRGRFINHRLACRPNPPMAPDGALDGQRG